MKADTIPENEFLQPDVFSSPKFNIDPSKWQDLQQTVWQRPLGLRCDVLCRQVAAVYDDTVGRRYEAAHQAQPFGTVENLLRARRQAAE